MLRTNIKKPHGRPMHNDINPSFKQVTSGVSEAKPDRSEPLASVLSEADILDHEGRRAKIDMAKPQQANGHLFEARVNKPNIFIVILNWNGKKDTLACLDSVVKLDYPNFRTLVVDNGSSDDSCREIRLKFPHITLLETGKNLGFSEGNNVAINQALQQGADAVLLLNNDTVVSPDLLTRFSEKMAENPSAGIYGATLFRFDEPTKLDHLGGMWNKKTARFDLIEENPPKELDYVCGAALLAKREVFEKVGFLESRFFLFWEEADFCFQAKKQGFSSITCPDAKVWHKVSASFVGGKPHKNYYWWRNRLLWMERNLSFYEKLFLSFRVLLPEITHLLKLKYIKSLELFVFGFLFSEKKITQKKSQLLQYKASIQGVKDYVFRRFGSGPAWLLQNRVL
jgi:GT2 family glycosyltransferase